MLYASIVDEFGDAVTDVSVTAMRYQYVQGRRQLVTTECPPHYFEVEGARIRLCRHFSTATLAAFGVACETREDGLVVCGQPDGPLRAADFDSRGDPGSAATATMLACRASGPTRVRRVDALGRRFPRLVGTLRALGAELRVEERVDDTLQS